MKKSRLVRFMLICLFSSVSFAAEHTVNPGESIQAAMNGAAYGDIIYVTAGTYMENVTLKNGVKLIGEDTNTTIIDGNQNGSAVTAVDCDPNTVIQGFTVTNGSGTTYNPLYNRGGGMYCFNSSPMVMDCFFYGNKWDAAIGGGGLVGGGIYSANGSPTVRGCLFRDNSALSGGGMYCVGQFGPSLNGKPVIVNCVFSGNTASQEGGGIRCGGLIVLTITNCTLSGNTAENGGGIYNNIQPYSQRSLTLTNCILYGNSALFLGDEIWSEPPYLDWTLISYSNIAGCGGSGEEWDAKPGKDGGGNIDINPLFANPNNGDFHLQSQRGRHDPTTHTWIQDSITSPCIDTGDPSTPIGWESYPNGGVVNMGVYGGTAEASKSYFGTTPCETPIAGDINGDCSVDLIDFSIMATHWLEDNRS